MQKHHQNPLRGVSSASFLSLHRCGCWHSPVATTRLIKSSLRFGGKGVRRTKGTENVFWGDFGCKGNRTVCTGTTVQTMRQPPLHCNAFRSAHSVVRHAPRMNTLQTQRSAMLRNGLMPVLVFQFFSEKKVPQTRVRTQGVALQCSAFL